MFETLDAGGISDAEASVCIDDPDASGDPRACPPGCKGLFRDHAYLICRVEAPWAAAETNCEAHGMQLVRIDDAAENAWINDVAFNSSPGIDRNWLGGSDLGTLGDWRWVDGAQFWSGPASGMPVGGLYTNWDPGEPNNFGEGENCLVMFAKATWNDDSCFTPHRYVCEAR